jgi:transketolase
VAVEAGSPLGWEQWTGPYGSVIALDRYGASAPYKTIFEQLGFTTDNVVLRALEAIDKSKK